MKRVAALVLLVALASPLHAQTSTTSTADSGGVTTPTTTNSNMNSTTTKLPRTASPLPLLSLGSLGALASGLWLSRRRQA